MARSMSVGDMRDSIIRNLKKGTGRDLAEWVVLCKAGGPDELKSLVRWLKNEHSLGSIKAQVVAGEALQKPFAAEYDEPDMLLDNMFAGKKAALRPLYEKAEKLILALGDVERKVCKTYVSYVCRRQIAVLQPTTQSALDIGFALPEDTEPAGRLEQATNVGGGRINFRIRVSQLKDIDAEVRRVLKQAYQADRLPN